MRYECCGISNLFKVRSVETLLHKFFLRHLLCVDNCTHDTRIIEKSAFFFSECNHSNFLMQYNVSYD